MKKILVLYATYGSGHKTVADYIYNYLNNKDYELLIAVMLSAQTTDKRVNSVTSILFKKYPTIIDLANADVNSIAEIIKPIGTYHKKAIFVKEIANILVNNYDCKVPNDRKKLESMPGVGRKTTNVVLANLFGNTMPLSA